MAQMNLTPFEDVLDDFYGKVGTPERDEHEAMVVKAVNSYKLGEAIKNVRQKQNLTQSELGERLGVKRSQICKLESGRGSITLYTMSKVFQALGISTATLDLGAGGKIALW